MYAKKAGIDLKGQNILAEGRIRAERKAGKLLKEMDKPLGGRPKTPSSVEGVKRPTLADMGLTHRTRPIPPLGVLQRDRDFALPQTPTDAI